MVQAGRLLRDPHSRLLRRQRRRRRRLPRALRQARLPPVAGDRLHLAAADVREPAAGRRLRHRRLLHDPSRLRECRGLPPVRRIRPPARHPRDRRSGDEPHLHRPRVVPGVAVEPGLAETRLVRLGGRGHRLPRDAGDLRRLGAVELDVGPGRRAVLLAPFLLAPARPELRQPRGAGGDAERAPLLAGPRHRRLPARRRPVPVRARRHQRREPARDARLPEAGPGRGRRALPRPSPARRGQPVAGGRRPLLRRRRRVSHVLPLPGDAPHVHVAAAGGGEADPGDPRPDARDSGGRAVGTLPPKPRRADARDGH